MLIDSPRITDRDFEHWANISRYDALLANNTRMRRLCQQATMIVEEWRDAGVGVISVSWGKDSVVAADIALKVDPTLPVVWVRSDPFETPECELVRDAFLATHPGCRYEERVAILRNPKRGEPGFEEHRLNGGKHQDVLSELIPERWISGLRGQESRMRQNSLRWHGYVTPKTARPLAGWEAPDIFAYLHRENLPVHPVYAMSFGGVLDRQWLRVHPLCSVIDSKTDVPAWEDAYYGDVIADALRIRAEWRAENDERGGINVPCEEVAA